MKDKPRFGSESSCDSSRMLLTRSWGWCIFDDIKWFWCCVFRLRHERQAHTTTVEWERLVVADLREHACISSRVADVLERNDTPRVWRACWC